MRASSDNEVVDFVAAYSGILDEMSTSPEGEVLGYINPIIKDNGKTPFPCQISWSNAQRYEVENDLQQCVKEQI